MGTATAAATAAAPLLDPQTFALQQGELDGRFADTEEKPAAPAEEPAEAGEDEEEEDDEDEDWSDDDVREAHAWLGTAEGPDGSTRLSATFSGAGGAARRPNANGGMLARTLQPLSNRQQKLASHFRAGPWRHGYCKHNPRKMVKIWAEKETRNLIRVGEKGIRCPKPVHLKLHVLAMEFIRKGGVHAPRLKDAALPDDKLRVAYFEIVTTMRTLYQKCKLVHGDLSEYNILYYEGHLYIIDVSQYVDLDHPLALDFLKEDCLHVNVSNN
ncbi:hypothetical protein ACQ4PT_047377 [Festuca glaucescens]